MNPDARRYFLCLPPDCSFPDFSASGWCPVAIDPRGEINRLTNNEILVGIYYIEDDATGEELQEFHERIYINYPDVNWIALVSEKGINCSFVRQQIAGWFYDYHTLPINHERMLFSMGRAYGMSCLSQKIVRKGGQGYQMVGNSEAMEQLYLAMDRVSSCSVPVLITGESGTGKELVAQAIHDRSDRAESPVIVLNCGALPPDLIQSELFGHEKGAFTGAYKRTIGRVEAADGGTLFLDEIGDLPLEMQTNLLRVLQEGVIQRVGSLEQHKVDVRVIAATHVKLEQAVAEKRFREDLYYRLNVVQLETPPLRKRDGDVELLAQYFLESFSAEANFRVAGFSYTALSAMQAHQWPGNVRELINRVRRAIIMSEQTVISALDLGFAGPESGDGETMNLEIIRARTERATIGRALTKTDYNISQTALLLGVSRRTLYRLMEKHGITSQSFLIPKDIEENACTED